MILLVHMLFGAAIGSKIDSIILAVVLAFIGHYFLDIFPHIEYLDSVESSIKNIRTSRFKSYLPDILKVASDFLLGILFIFLLSNPPYVAGVFGRPIIYICALIAIVPDGLTVVSKLFPNRIFDMHDKIHTQKIHYFKYHGLQDTFELFGFNFKTRQSEKSGVYAKHSGEPFFAKPQLKLKTESQNLHLATHDTNKKVPNFWRITTQVLAIIVSIILLKL